MLLMIERSYADVERLLMYDDLVRRIYADGRMSTGTREIALAMARVKFREPEVVTDSRFWDLVFSLLGRTIAGWRGEELIRDDAPRYEPPRSTWQKRPCEGPRIRPYRPRRTKVDPDCAVYLEDGYTDPLPPDDRVCGAPGTTVVIEYDLVTGWQTGHWFCRRHLDRADEVRSQISLAGDPPPAIPNCGGLLPCYFDGDWENLYARYRRHWSPPYHGICADDWPGPGLERVPRPPRLSVIK